ncbi:MAG: FKBP-type peptidyl-prolyl cis-trans isomerase [Bacteroidota bacterium]
MKKLCLLLIGLICLAGLNAQNGAKTKTVATKPTSANPTTILKTLNDSASYAVGMSVANFYRQQGISKLNAAIVSKAINDVLGGKKPLCSDAAANEIMNRYMNKMQEEKAKAKITEGQNFLAKNKLRPEVKTTASGLQYEVLVQGTGKKPIATDTVVCDYRGTYINGIGFDNSYDRGAPATFAVLGVIPGWTEGLQLMNVGSKFKFYVPYTLGYGAFDYNEIPGGSMLIFEIDLIAIKNSR